MISIVIVLFNPDYGVIKNNISLITKYQLIIVDNSTISTSIITSFWPKNVVYINNGANLGIAAAKNIGIKKAIELNCEYIIFFDQDSCIESNYPNNIVERFKYYKNTHTQLAILGPNVYNEHTKEKYESVIFKHNVITDDFIQKPNIISSGCCISTAIFSKTGLFEEQLFIDNVDTEFCWRVTKYGYEVGICNSLQLAHNIGQSEIKFGKYRVIISSPFRYFYQYRNYLWLCRRKYAPIRWKINTGIKFLLRIFYFPFILRNAFEIEKNIFKGIIAGIFKSPNYK